MTWRCLYEQTHTHTHICTHRKLSYLWLSWRQAIKAASYHLLHSDRQTDRQNKKIKKKSCSKFNTILKDGRQYYYTDRQTDRFYHSVVWCWIQCYSCCSTCLSVWPVSPLTASVKCSLCCKALSDRPESRPFTLVHLSWSSWSPDPCRPSEPQRDLRCCGADGSL